MQPKQFQRLPLGAIQPAGWLKDQLRIQADGLSGHLADFWPDVGEHCDWLGGHVAGWERAPYYLDGLYPLAVLLGDEALLERAQRYIEYILGSQKDDGWFGPDSCKDDYWPMTIALKVLIQYQEYTGDERVIPFMQRYFNCQMLRLYNQPLGGWSCSRAADNIYCALWLYERTEEAWLLDLCQTLADQGIDWSGLMNNLPWTRGMKYYYPTDRQNADYGLTSHQNHVVNVAMGIKYPAMKWRLTGRDFDRDAALNGIDSLMRYHGQAAYIFSGDEHLSGPEPTRGTELCSVVEYLFSLHTLLEVYGDAEYADILERVAYNALPATISKDWWQHQYLQQANQVMATDIPNHWFDNNDESNTFGLEPNYGCCTANMHQGWPKFAANLFFLQGKRCIVAPVYAPAVLETAIGDQDLTQVRIAETTEYPFRDTVQFCITLSKPDRFTFRLRIPDWCDAPELILNGNPLAFEQENGFADIDRQWQTGDTLTLRLPRTITLALWHNDSAAVEYGPLVFSLRIEERWIRRGGQEPHADYDILPGSPWNYALYVDPDEPAGSFTVEERPYSRQPFDRDCPPILIHARAIRDPQWKLQDNHVAADVPQSPITLEGEPEEITLAPYGACKLRVTAFPWVDARI